MSMTPPEDLTDDDSEHQDIDLEATEQIARVHELLHISKLNHPGFFSKNNSYGTPSRSMSPADTPPPRRYSLASNIAGSECSTPTRCYRSPSSEIEGSKSSHQMPETKPLSHEIDRSGLPSHLFNLNTLETNKVFVRDEAREITHIFEIEKFCDSKNRDSDRGVYYTSFAGKPAVLKFFGDALGWKGTLMRDRECEARERLNGTGVLPEIYLSGEVILGKFGNRTCRGYAIVMERIKGVVLSNLEMSLGERRELRVALLKIMTVIRLHNIVHGEPRRRNVIWDRESQRAVLLDWKKWWENDYQWKPHEKEIEIIMASDKSIHRASSRHSNSSP
ncbi:hypothetical protein TWF694_001896 [Orbilia ellipsospora]|uniref:Protein kinase domain-containing protein n=1 Tax=Orbilia ellipsospora TaxID=2528407 RepID=A0AAV9X538_9PEZI